MGSSFFVVFDEEITSMGIYARFENFDDIYHHLDTVPKFVNDYDVSRPEQREALDLHIYTHYKNTDVIETSAACHCGYYTKAQDIGYICDKCHTEIVSTVDRAIESTLWLRAPEGTLGFIHPEFWSILEQKLGTRSFDFLRYLVNTNYNFDYTKITSKDAQRTVDKFLSFNPPRGLNNFIRHFDEIMEGLFSRNIVNGSKTEKEELKELIRENRECLFPKYLPVPSRLCFVVETTTSSTYIDAPLRDAMNAVNAITSIRSAQEPMSERMIQNVTFLSCESMAKFYDSYITHRISKKPGLARRHIFGNRLHMSARGVIDSINDPHYFTEIHIPWGMALQLFKYHILNKLIRRNYTVREGMDVIYQSVLCYNELVDEILHELINESPLIDEEFTDKRGIAVSLQRNPTLQRGSTQQFFITRVKTKTRNNTISMSPICLRAPNADEPHITHRLPISSGVLCVSPLCQ